MYLGVFDDGEFESDIYISWTKFPEPVQVYKPVSKKIELWYFGSFYTSIDAPRRADPESVICFA